MVKRAISSILRSPSARLSVMTRAGTGEARLTALRAVLSAATYALELAIIAATYLGPCRGRAIAASDQSGRDPVVAADRRGARSCPAARLSSLAGDSLGIFFRACLSSGAILSSNAMTDRSLLESGSIAIGTDARRVRRRMADQSLVIRHRTFATPLGIAKFALISLVPTAMISSAVAVAGLVLANDFGLPILADSLGTWT